MDAGKPGVARQCARCWRFVNEFGSWVGAQFLCARCTRQEELREVK